ncbi:unnamed protein product [Mortierella alpina]
MAASNHSSSSLHEQRLCDWERSVADCKDPGFMKATLIACAVLHLLVGAYGIWVLRYRNGGFKNSIVTNVFIVQRNNIRPRPAQGHLETAAILESVHYTVFGVQEYAWSLVVLYYGLKFTFVLRAHITATEARDHIPPKTFGLRDLKSGSPARYLLIMVKITVAARGAILLFGGTIVHIRAWEGGDFLRPENEHWSHLMAVVWTCAITIAYTAQLTLIAVHCSRNRPKSVNNFESGISPLQMASGDRGLDMLTLHLNTDRLGSGSEISLDQALSRLAKAYQSGEPPTDFSMRLDTDRSREADKDEEDLRKRVPRSIPISRSVISLVKEASKPGAAGPRSSSIANEQQLGMQEFR